MEIQNLYFNQDFFYWNEILYNSGLFLKNIGMLDYKRPFSSCKSNEEWPHIALQCYNESEVEIFYMKWLIVDKLTEVRLMSLSNVWRRL